MNVEQLRQLEQAATPGEWRVETYEDGSGAFVVRGMQYLIAEARPSDHGDQGNARLIAAMRNALPALLDIAEAAQDVVPSTEFLDHIPGPYAYVRVDELKAVADALSRLDDR